jgi:hypothetical protein
MRTTRIDQYICIDVDRLVADEMKNILSCTAKYTHKEDRDYSVKVKRAAKVIFGYYTINGEVDDQR